MSTSSKVHEILKDQSSSMDSVDNKLLFGEDFEANLLKESKALKKSESLFTGLSNKSSTSSSSTSWSAGKLPFRKGPLFQGRGRGQQSVWKSPNFYQGKGQERGKHSFSFHKTDNRNTSLPIFKGTSNGKVSFFSGCGFKYHPSRESRGVHRKLESSDTGLSNFKHDQGIQNSLCIKTSSSKYSFPSKSGGGGKFASGSRDPSNASQRCNKGSRIHTGPISQLNFPSAKKGFRTETCNKSKKVEQLYPIPPFQNGECFSSEGNTSERGPYVQNRPQRCILFSSSSSRLTEICKVSVEGQAISIPLPVFWTGACTKKFYQNNESSSSSFEKTQYKVDNIFRRHIDTSFMSQRDGDGEGHSTHLGFTINFQKSVVQPTHKIKFLGVEVDSMSLKLSLPMEKVEQIIAQCETLLAAERVTIRDVTRLVGRLSSAAIAVLPAPLQYRATQRQQILELSSQKNYESFIKLSPEVKEELVWWVRNLHLSNGRLLLVPPPQLIISTDASKQGWGAACKGYQTGGQWSAGEKTLHINILELKAVKLALYCFHHMFPSIKSIHWRIDNIVALTYLKKMGGTHSRALTDLSKQIWEYLLSHKITITVEYLPGVLNVEADTMSRNVKDSSEWKLNKQVFLDICRVRGTPCTDLFASRLSHQVPHYFSWKIDPYSISADAFQACWTHLKGYAFPPFSLISWITKRNSQVIFFYVALLSLLATLHFFFLFFFIFNFIW